MRGTHDNTRAETPASLAVPSLKLRPGVILACVAAERPACREDSLDCKGRAGPGAALRNTLFSAKARSMTTRPARAASLADDVDARCVAGTPSMTTARRHGSCRAPFTVGAATASAPISTMKTPYGRGRRSRRSTPCGGRARAATSPKVACGVGGGSTPGAADSPPLQFTAAPCTVCWRTSAAESLTSGLKKPAMLTDSPRWSR